MIKILRLLLTLTCLLLGMTIWAQTSSGIQSKIVDSKTGSPVPFATVKVMKGRQIMGGVISNGDGGFKIPSGYRDQMDSIVISCIGYKNRIIRMNDLLPDRLNVIKIVPAKIKLNEVVITPKHQEKLTANKIVHYAIQNIPRNYPTHPFSYLAYYRDYQKEAKAYVNLNEGVVRIFDKGFQTDDYDSTRIRLYQYQLNRDFKQDSAAAIAYDNNSSGNKFIPSATVGSFGGNELSILRIHDAIRNYAEKTYSFVNEFRYDFAKNHSFKWEETVSNNDLPLYHITFQTFYFITKATYIARGDIFIEHGNYAIHKLVYSNYLRERNQETLLYNIQVEYARVDSLMYPNYLTVNNIFKSRSEEEFKTVDLIYDHNEDAFVITFNHIPDPASAGNKKNYNLKFAGKPFRIDTIALSQKNKKEVHVFVSNAKDFNFKDRPAILVQKLEATIHDIKDVKGNVLNVPKYELVNQFRELFLQKLDPATTPPDSGSFITKSAPLQQNKIDTTLAAFGLWMNTPLKDNSNWVQKNGEKQSDSIAPTNQQPLALNPAPENDITLLEEKAYVQSDKPYYYAGEKIWFNVYMNYHTPQLKDSLSRALYVELVRSDGTIAQSAILHLENGEADGAFSLAASEIPGDYAIRSYTNWMLNFGHQDMFIKQIKILGLFETPEIVDSGSAPEQATPDLALSTTKKTYSPRELVTLEIGLHDAYGKPVGGSLSVSVTDLDQVKTVPQEKTILKNYPFEKLATPPQADSLPNAMETGIALKGTYASKKKQSAKPKLMVIQTHDHKMDDYELVDTDSAGKFVTHGFQFYDSAEIGFKVDGGKPHAGEITLEKRYIPPATALASDPVFKIHKATQSQRPELAEQFTPGAILLQEVEVKDTKLKEKPSDSYYGTADYSIPEATVQKYNSIITALQSKVPGLQVSGTVIRFGNSSFGSGDPLVVLDGVRITSEPLVALNSLDPQIIERIDVFKYGGAAIYGTAGANGVIIVHTKKSKYADDKGKPETIDLSSFQVFKVPGYAVASAFKSPDYSVPQKMGKSDYRSTLLWQPHVVVSPTEGVAKVVFYTADVATRYRIVVEGVTDDLRPVRNVMYVDVKK